MQYLLKSHGYLRAGVGTLASDSEAAPTWLGYIRVENIDVVLQRTLAHGGKVLLKPRQDIADGELAIIADPTGATVGLLKWDYENAETPEAQP
jgi:predicted enzyme related to lactoylglutathione lyase